MKDFLNLSNKVAFVTGASGEIGKSISESLINQNVFVYGFDQNPSNLTDSKKYSHFECDLTNTEVFQSICKDIFMEHSRIDILINNAGIAIPTSDTESYSSEYWEKTLKINLSAPFFCSQIVKSFMEKNNKGSIINITSISAKLGFEGNPAYGASKGGLRALSKSLASEWSVHGIRVNCIGPGYVGEGMTRKSYVDEKIRKHRESMMMIKKWNTSHDIANACLFLSSDASGYMTGQDIYIDGGWTSKGFPDLD